MVVSSLDLIALVIKAFLLWPQDKIFYYPSGSDKRRRCVWKGGKVRLKCLSLAWGLWSFCGWRTRRMHLKSKPVKELRISVKYRASVLESKTAPSLGSWINGKARISADSTANSLRWFCASASAFGEYHYSFIPRLISEVMGLSPMSKRVCSFTKTRFVCKRYRRPNRGAPSLLCHRK